MDTYINLSNLEGRKKVFLVLFLLIFNLFFPSLVPSSCTLLCHRGSFWVSLSQVRKMSLLHVVWERKVEGMLQRTLSVELCLRWMSSPGYARDGPSLLSAQFGGGRKRTPSSLLQLVGRIETKSQSLFSKIFWLKLDSYPAVINTSFSEQVISISAEVKKKSFSPPIFPKENLC